MIIYCGGHQTSAVWYRGHWWCDRCGETVSAVSLDSLTRGVRLTSVTGTSASSS